MPLSEAPSGEWKGSYGYHINAGNIDYLHKFVLSSGTAVTDACSYIKLFSTSIANRPTFISIHSCHQQKGYYVTNAVALFYNYKCRDMKCFIKLTELKLSVTCQPVPESES